MAKVVCTLPNAGTNINGIDFAPVPGVGMVSVDDVDADTMTTFLAIPGYAEFDGGDPEPPRKQAKAAKSPKAPKGEDAGDTGSQEASGAGGDGADPDAGAEGAEKSEETPVS